MSYRVLVCGGRDYAVKPRNILDHDYEVKAAAAERDRVNLYYILTAFDDSFGISVLGHGDARGADRLAGQWAADFRIPCEVFPADWKAFGNSAGVIRNREMIEKFSPHVVIAFRGGSGTAHCVDFAKRRGIAVLLAQDPKVGV